MKIPETVTVPTAAVRLSVHKRTILRWLADGTLKGFKIGRRWEIRVSSINVLLTGTG